MGAVELVKEKVDVNEKVSELIKVANNIILDKEKEIKLSLACLFAKGHLLIEDRPGMGKTTLVKTLAKLLGLESQRIQFTNDLLPADILGASIFNQETRKFDFHKGPIFANFVLADELNRATPKTQSACLQAMEENQVSIDGVLHQLPNPFFLVATQNPQENIGTFQLPESQVDRFLMRIELGLPSRAAEREILTGTKRSQLIEDVEPVTSHEDLRHLFAEVESIHSSDVVLDYLQDLIERSRSISKGVSPRAAKDLHLSAKSWALLSGRDFVIPEDLQAVLVSVLNHRIGSGASNEVQSGVEIAQEILHSVKVP